MFPLRDDNPTLHKAIVTYVVILLNVLVWFFVEGMGSGQAMAKSICSFALFPGELLGNIHPGAKIPIGEGIACLVGNHSHWYTVITSMFLHGGWFHIIGNMWFMWVFADNVEDVLGSVKFIFFYLVCGTAAAAAQIISDPTSSAPMLGASGAISGVMGAYAVFFPRAPVQLLIFLGFFITRVWVPAIVMLGYWFLLQLLSATIGGEGGVAFWAHIGGFAAGVVIAKLFYSTGKLEEHRLKRGRIDKLVRWKNPHW